jgi:hypothetical protein
MLEAYGSQQGDAWLKNRVGRITGSRLADVVSYLSRASSGKKAGDPSAKRDAYKMELISERLTGRSVDHYVTPAMEWGIEHEVEAKIYFEGATNQTIDPVGFVVHPDYSFWGCSPDGLVGEEGVYEGKAPNTVTHLRYIADGVIPEEYYPQIVGELACPNRKFCEFVSYDPRIADDDWRFFYRRVDRDSLEWEYINYAGEKPQSIKLTGESVIEYFTSEVVKFEGEIQEFLNGHRTIAPFPVNIK